MTTKVNISLEHLQQGKRLSVKIVDPDVGTLYRHLICDEKKLAEHGGKYTFEDLYVHPSSKLVVEELDG